MDKQEFINKVDSFLSNIQLKYMDIYGQVQEIYFDKLLKTTNIILNDLPFDSIDKMFKTEVEFWGITKEYWNRFSLFIKKEYSKLWKSEVTRKPTNSSIGYCSKNDYDFKSVLQDTKSGVSWLDTTMLNGLIYIKEAGGHFKQYDKMFVNNTYLKFNDYLFFKKYFNLDISNIDIYYPVMVTNKETDDFKIFDDLFNISVIAETKISSNNSDIIKIKDNEIIGVNPYKLKNCEGQIYNNTYYNFFKDCSVFNVIKYFIYGLLQYKQIETNNYSNILLEKTEILKTDENIDKSVSQNMIERLNYNTINEEELLNELAPIPNDEMYKNEQHIILQGIFEDIQKFCNNIEKYIAGAVWEFDKVDYNQFKNIDEKIEYLENILNTYKKSKLDLRGYNSKFTATKINKVVGDSDNLNYLNLTETENNFLHIEKMLQNNNYPLFAKINLINQIRQSINLYLTKIKELADNKKFYDEQQTESLLWGLRDTYDKLAKAVASQEQPFSFGNPNYNGNPNEEYTYEEMP